MKSLNNIQTQHLDQKNVCVCVLHKYSDIFTYCTFYCIVYLFYNRKLQLLHISLYTMTKNAKVKTLKKNL